MTDPGHEALIRTLAERLPPVRTLRAPWLRAALWGAAVAAIAGALVASSGIAPLRDKLEGRPDEWCEFIGAGATALLAGYAAFTVAIPGRSSRWALLPLPSLCLWVGASSAGCWRATAAGIDLSNVHPPMSCFRFLVLISIPFSALMAWMLSRAYPLRPALAATLGGLAAAAAAGLAIDFIHPFDVTMEDLVAHLSAAALVVAANRWLAAKSLRRAALAAVVTLAPPADAAVAERPLVLELFTSEGCSSCPPADALLTAWAQSRRDLLPLAFHVDYWNGLGWADPFSSPAFTARERQHAARLGEPTVYTPELVVEGRQAVVGSDQLAADAALAAARARAETAAAIGITRDGADAVIDVGPGRGDATLLLVGFDSAHRTPVGRGENGGRTLLESNVVRSFSAVAAWHGQALRLRAPLPPGERLAVLLEASDGHLVGAAAEPY